LARRERARAREAEPLRNGANIWKARKKAEYRLRNLIERLNADAKKPRHRRLPVRGPLKAKTILLWYALANNLDGRLD